MSEPDECFVSDPAIRRQMNAKHRQQRRAEALARLVDFGRECVAEGEAACIRECLEWHVQDYDFGQDDARDVVGEAMVKIEGAL
jgi:hypothetical protein